MGFFQLLDLIIEKKASDLHLLSDAKPVFRIDGKLTVLDTELYSSTELEKLVQNLMNEKQKKIFEERNECDLSYRFRDEASFRINIFRQRGLIHVALRIIPTDIPSFEELGLPPIVQKICENRRGLILVTGTTGSGKSTTLAAMIDYINNTRSGHIITIEDPIEFIHKDKMCIVSQRELGSDTTSYSEALKHVVRQDPDVILIGEMRDLETMSAALTAAQLGHLVLATIHTIDTVQTAHRIVDVFPPHHQNQIRLQLSDTLKGVISQRLLPRISGNGRTPAVEVLVVTPLVRKLIEQNSIAEIPAAIKQGAYYGMQTFNQALIQLYNSEKIKLDDALACATNPEEIMMAIRGIESGTNVSL